MVTLAARADILNQEDIPPIAEVKWCPGCNCTRPLDHFTPLRLGVPYYRPFCNDCAPLSPHQRLGWFYPLVRTVWTSLCNLAVPFQTVSFPKKARHEAENAESRVDWLANSATGSMEFVRLGDGLLIDMSSPDVPRLLASLHSCEGTLKQHGEGTPDQRKEMRHVRSGHTFSSSLEHDPSVQTGLGPIEQSELRDTKRFQHIGQQSSF